MDVTPPTTEGMRMAKTSRYTSCSNEVRHRSDCKCAPRSIHEDLRGRTSADGLERRTSHQDTKEKKSEEV
ncbi:unnamed protein product [Schistosoma mattheei]|uniref:Uncharacterized protein n=1 Tax=Schistosoma mattheei TaxID=31246 RepID=A0A183Q7L3_9TREM|nr:unnamed protein product [Schistosoma mattheei]